MFFNLGLWKEVAEGIPPGEWFESAVHNVLEDGTGSGPPFMVRILGR
jgi:hypothetical protein